MHRCSPLVVSVFALTFALFVFATTPALAALATATQISGPVSVTPQSGQPRALAVGHALNDGDLVECAQNASATLKLSDGSTLTLSEHTLLEINEEMLEQGADVSFSHFFGMISAIIFSMQNEELVSTPTMAIGIRGTRFSVSVALDGATVTSVEEGRVAVSSSGDDSAPAAPITITAGREAEALAPGRRLKTRQKQIATYQQARQFFRQRVENMLPTLKEKLPQQRDAVQEQIATLKRLADVIETSAQSVLELQKKIRSLRANKRLNVDQLRKLKPEIAQKVIQLKATLRQFRRRAMRVKNTFFRAGLLQRQLPAYKQKMTENEFSLLMAEIQTTLAIQENAAKQVRTQVKRVKKAMRSIRRGRQKRRKS